MTGVKKNFWKLTLDKSHFITEVGMNYNLPKSEDSRQPQCPMEKEKAIRDALEHFGMI